MPVSPTPDESYYWEIAQAYQQAELQILSQIRDRLDKGQTLSDVDWATSRLAEVQVMRRQAVATLATVNRSMSSKINGAFGNAYKDGSIAALRDASAYLPGKPSAVSSVTRQNTVAALANRTREGLAGVIPNMLRKMEDDYREVVRSTVAATQAGGNDRRKATTAALQQAYGKGLKTGPDGRMNLPDYVQMAVRTGTANASIQGHLDTLAANDLNLVYIQPGPRHCERCDEWANVPLWRTTGPAGRVQTESMVSDRDVTVNVKGSLEEAKAAGWGHPNCRCSVGAYLPGVTEKTLPTPRPKWDADGYKDQQTQRAIERKIREWKTREALSTDPADKADAARKVSQWQAAQRAHLNAHPALKRQYQRENPAGLPPIEGKRKKPTTDGPPTVPGSGGERWTTPSGSREDYFARVKDLDLEIDPERMPKAHDLTDREREVAEWYTGPFYSEINKRARFGDLPLNKFWQDHDIDTTIQTLDHAISRGVFEQDTRVMRTGRWSELGAIHGKRLGEDGYRSPWYHLEGDELAEYAKQYVGKEFSPGGFLSTSTPLKGAKTTVEKAPYEGSNDVVYNLLVPKGSRGSTMAGINSRSSEREVILPRDTSLQIVDAVVDPVTKQLRITAIVRNKADLPTKPAAPAAPVVPKVATPEPPRVKTVQHDPGFETEYGPFKEVQAGAVRAGDWRYIGERQKRAVVLLQNDYRAEKPVKAVAQNIREGKDPFQGVKLEKSWSERYVGKPAYSKDAPSFTLADVRTAIEDAARWLLDQETVKPRVLYKGLEVPASKMGDLKPGATFDANFSSFTTDDSVAYKYTPASNRVVVRVRGAESVSLKDSDNPSKFGNGTKHKEHLVTGTGRIVKVTKEGSVTWVDVEF